VLDLVCYHKGTAKNLCEKLCRWFISDTPSNEFIDKTMSVWISHQQSEDQLLKVVAYILNSPEFMANLDQKIKRPNHLLFSTIRALNLGITPTVEWGWILAQMGWKQFSWSLPTGHPDEAHYWLNTDMLLKRWNSLPMLLYFNMEQGNDRHFSTETLQLKDTYIETIIDYWSNKLLGHQLASEIKGKMASEAIVDMEEMKGQEWKILAKDYPEGLEYKLMQIVGMIALSPDFHKR
jgi:hypothetical protein